MRSTTNIISDDGVSGSSSRMNIKRSATERQVTTNRRRQREMQLLTPITHDNNSLNLPKLIRTTNNGNNGNDNNNRNNHTPLQQIYRSSLSKLQSSSLSLSLSLSPPLLLQKNKTFKHITTTTATTSTIFQHPH